MLMGIEEPGILAYYDRDADPYAPWIAHALSKPGFGGTYRCFHSLGTGDSDGMTDVLTTAGGSSRRSRVRAGSSSRSTSAPTSTTRVPPTSGRTAAPTSGARVPNS